MTDLKGQAVWRLTSIVEEGFSSTSYDHGLFGTRERAEQEAIRLEPNKSIRDYTYYYTKETIQ